MLSPIHIFMSTMNDINENNSSIIDLTLGYLNPTCVKTFCVELYIFKKRHLSLIYICYLYEVLLGKCINNVINNLRHTK